ncbi:hypothetical protein KGF57_000084 [Candida theae]|uniref:RING-type domain-containing protein n=1 Tax=Candida theae TaxID=1198502 RepID=A0AAD5G172_9ASCO|nr:uncharacterized protein KGF57_000084 [Candida theae]KAI5968815.1 hypothetical protein KGF57_000084 [Candida theae]
MPTPHGDSTRRRRRESGQEPPVIDISSDDNASMNPSNGHSRWQNSPTRHSRSREYSQAQVQQHGRNPSPTTRNHTGQGSGNPTVLTAITLEEDDSDDDIEILSINTTHRTPSASNTDQINSHASQAPYITNTLQESGNGDDDVEITSVRQSHTPPQAHIDTPIGHIAYHPEFESVYPSNEQIHPMDNRYPTRNVRRRLGHIPMPPNARATRSHTPRSNVGHRGVQLPSSRREAQHSRGNMALSTGGDRRQGATSSRRGGQNQHRPVRSSRSGSSLSHRPIPDFINRINFHIRVPDPSQHFFFSNLFGVADLPPDVLESNIMQRIEEDNNRAVDARRERESNYNRKFMAEKQKLAEAENAKGTHTNKVDPSEDLVCELCSVTLGEGAPDDFKGNPKYDLNFAKYAEQYQTQAPWFCVNPFTDADHDLSKRIFVSKCGHTFCGRCVKNIAGRPTKKPKDAPSGFTIKNPSIYAPTKCPAKDCGKKFVSKAFTEVFF